MFGLSASLGLRLTLRLGFCFSLSFGRCFCFGLGLRFNYRLCAAFLFAPFLLGFGPRLLFRLALRFRLGLGLFLGALCSFRFRLGLRFGLSIRLSFRGERSLGLGFSCVGGRPNLLDRDKRFAPIRLNQPEDGAALSLKRYAAYAGGTAFSRPVPTWRRVSA